jgi:hypothetical protein
MSELENTLIGQINKKIDKSPMFYDMYSEVLNVYKQHILGEASIEKPIKKKDFGAFYQAVGGVFSLNKKEINYLIRNSTEESALEFTKKILGRDEASQRLLDELLITEHNIAFSRRVEPEVYMKDKVHA